MRPEAGALSGVRVLEAGTLIAGPFAGRLLADMGADVIKVEAPDTPDPGRHWGQGSYRGRSLLWPVQSRNKRLVTLDLRQGRDLFLDLVRESDVVVENFRPGTMEKWGLGFDDLERVNPGLVMARVSGYGQTGPYADRAGYASVAEAMSGLRSLNGFPDQPPPRTGISLGDALGAMFAVQGILAALRWRDVGGGHGQVVDVSLVESCFALLESAVPEYDLLGAVRQPGGTGLAGVAPSNLFRSRDGKWVVIAANQDTVFTRLCTVMGRPDLAADPRFATHQNRGRHQADIEAEVAAWAATLDAADLDRRLNDAGVVCGAVQTVADVFDDPQLRARDMLLTHDDPELGPFVGPGITPKLSATPGSVRWTGPWTPGAHNAEVYGDLLGLTAADLARLAADGVI
jgi:crotonobetainyl-CoA:carnitine CoA-transferase CaiB-like acyl-CoA transferase